MTRTWLLATALALLPAAAMAGAKDDALQALLKCADIADKDARIACFDQATPQLRAAVQLPPAEPATPPAVAAAAPPQPEQAPPPQARSDSAPPPAEAPPQSGSQATTILSSFNPFSDSGSDRPSAQQMAFQPIGSEILPITIQLRDVDVQPGVGFTVTLANGQVWTEHKGHHETPHFKSDGPNIVTIERGMLGGYNMFVQGTPGQFKVDRVK